MMKSMLIAALALVIAVCFGISRYCSRRSTQTALSIIGKMITRPGPRSPMARPRRKSTIRWDSRTILIAFARISRTSRATMPATIRALMGLAPWLDGQRAFLDRGDDFREDLQAETLHRHHQHGGARRDRPTDGFRGPGLPTHVHPAGRLQRGLGHPVGPFQCLGPRAQGGV